MKNTQNKFDIEHRGENTRTICVKNTGTAADLLQAAREITEKLNNGLIIGLEASLKAREELRPQGVYVVQLQNQTLTIENRNAAGLPSFIKQMDDIIAEVCLKINGWL